MMDQIDRLKQKLQAAEEQLANKDLSVLRKVLLDLRMMFTSATKDPDRCIKSRRYQMV